MNSNRPFLFLLLAFTLLSQPYQVEAQQTTAFTYQGQLRDGGTNANGNYTMTFKLYNAVSGGVQIGSHIATSASLANGLFSVNLDFGAGAFNGSSRWLDITAQSGTNAPETLTPRVQVLPAPYALFATVAATVTNGAIMNAQLAGNAVSTTNIQNGAVTTAQIAPGAVTNANLTSNAVATANIQGNAVTDEKINSVSGSKVFGRVALATSADELHTYVTTTINSNVTAATFWDVYPALAANPPYIAPHDLIFSANGVLQMVIKPSIQDGPMVAVVGAFSADRVVVNGDIKGNRLVLGPDGCKYVIDIEGNCNGYTALRANNNFHVVGALQVDQNIFSAANVFASNNMFAQQFVQTSDRNVKENFALVNGRDVLERVASLPISSWNFKTDVKTRHIGPMAQDFYAAFNVGADDKHISTVDESGVALAAIQGLHEKMKEKDIKIEAMEKRLADLEESIKSSTHK